MPLVLLPMSWVRIWGTKIEKQQTRIDKEEVDLQSKLHQIPARQKLKAFSLRRIIAEKTRN